MFSVAAFFDSFGPLILAARFPILISVLGIGLGLVIGALICAARLSPVRGLRRFAAVWVSFLRGVPLLVQLLLVYYLLPVIGIDVPPVVGSANAILASAAARVSLRLPPGTTGKAAQDALVEHLRSRVPWGLRCEIERVALGDPFVGSLEGPAYEALKAAMEQAFGKPMTTEGQGGSIPLCNVLAETYPDAEIMLLGVEEPKCLIHAPNESVDPTEIENMALVEALFLERYAAAVAGDA